MTNPNAIEGGNMAKRWALYVRVSTKQQVDGFSLDDQKDKLIAYAESQGWDYVLFEDRGVSGETLDRPGMTAMLGAVDAGTVQGVLTLDETRIGRDNLVLATIWDKLERAGVLLAYPGRGIVDLSDPSTAFMVEMLGSVAALEQKMRTNKMKAGLRRTAEAGYWPGGPAPYGYVLVPSEDGKHTVLAVNEEEAQVLRLAADLIVDRGYSTYAATNHLNGLGIRTRRNRPWRHENLCGQLRKPHTVGLFVYDPQNQRIEFSIPRIFSQNEWDALQGAIKGTPRRSRKNRRYSLTGRGRPHLRCVCGGNFSGSSDRGSKKGPMYGCSNNSNSFGAERCPHRPRSTKADVLDAAVWEQVIAALTDTEYLASLAMSHLKATSDGDESEYIGVLRARLTNLRIAETEIVRSLAEGDGLHGDALERALNETATDRKTIEKELARIEEAQRGALNAKSVPEAVHRLSRLATTRLSNPNVELMAEVFDLLEVDLIRIEGRTFEGVARIPLPDPEDTGEVWKGAPLAP